jgi:hypothetical protein
MARSCPGILIAQWTTAIASPVWSKRPKAEAARLSGRVSSRRTASIPPLPRRARPSERCPTHSTLNCPYSGAASDARIKSAVARSFSIRSIMVFRRGLAICFLPKPHNAIESRRKESVCPKRNTIANKGIRNDLCPTSKNYSSKNCYNNKRESIFRAWYCCSSPDG